MAEDKTTPHRYSFSQSQRRQPLSLNQRHDRMLVDLSTASHSKQFPKMPFSGVKNDHAGGRSLCDTFSSVAKKDDVPSFSGIADFDSPPPDLSNEKQAQIESNSTLEEAVDIPNFSGIVDFDSPSSPPPPPDEMKPNMPNLDSSKDLEEDNNVIDTKAVNSSGSSDCIQNPQGEAKPMKVRIKGRRRLCKMSKRDDNCDKERNDITRNEDVKFSEISDFDSLPQAKNGVESNNGGCGNEIMDILNDLSSKLEILSIEKKRKPRKIDLNKEAKYIVESKVNHVEKKEEFPEYESAASAFSISSDSSLRSEESRVGDAPVNECGKMYSTDDESEGERNLGNDKRSNNFGERVKKNDVKGGNSVPSRQSFKSTILKEEEEEEDDDCVLLNVKDVKKTERMHGKLKHSDELYEVDVVEEYADDFVLEKEHTIPPTRPKSKFGLLGKIAKMLYPHQRDSLKWLWSLHCKSEGGILGDDMGLGKTMQICGFLAGLFRSSLIKRALVVAPKTLLPHWIKELSAVGLSEKTREYFGTNVNARQYELQYVLQDKGVLLTTYDIVRNNSKSLSGDNYYHDDGSVDDFTWDYIIIDEGHLIKNPITQRSKSLLEIPAVHRIIISGTPLQNNLKELWALFNFCCPELRDDYKGFRDKYEKLINRGNEKNASDREKRIGSNVAKELREKIQPYFLRRLKSEVFREDDDGENNKLSKKNEIIVWLKLTNCQVD